MNILPKKTAPKRSRKRRKPSTTTPVKQFSASYHRASEVGEGAEQKQKSPLRLFAYGAIAVILGASFLWYSVVEEVEIRGDIPAEAAEELKEDAHARYQFFQQVHAGSLDAYAALHRRDISNVTPRRQVFARRLTLHVEPRRTALLWQSGDTTYLVDDLGVAVSVADTEDDLPLVVDVASLPVSEGEQIAPATFVTFVEKLHQQTTINIDTMRVVDTTSELILTLEEGYDARMATDQDVQLQIENITRLQRVADEENETISEYVDVRLPHKGYYR